MRYLLLYVAKSYHCHTASWKTRNSLHGHSPARIIYTRANRGRGNSAGFESVYLLVASHNLSAQLDASPSLCFGTCKSKQRTANSQQPTATQSSDLRYRETVFGPPKAEPTLTPLSEANSNSSIR